MMQNISLLLTSKYFLATLSVWLMVSSIKGINKNIKEKNEMISAENKKINENKYYDKLVGFNKKDIEWQNAFIQRDVMNLIVSIITLIICIYLIIK